MRGLFPLVQRNEASLGRRRKRQDQSALQQHPDAVAFGIANNEKNKKMTSAADRIPVIVGVGEFSDHPTELTAGMEPLALMVQALKSAEQDAGAKLLREIDSLDVVNFLSWRYAAPEKQLSNRLGIAPKHAHYGPVGGESPIRFIHEAAKRIARGEASVAAICGAEAQSTATKAERDGVTLPWTPFAHDAPEPLRGANYQRPMATTLGVAKPVTVYPFYEAASAAHWGQTPRQAHDESGELWSRYSKVAAQNPEAWLKRAYTPEEITTVTPANRLIAWPYTKLMVANPMVNQAAAILITSQAKARAAGIAEDRMVYVHGGASAEEPRDYLDRDQFYESHAQNAVLKVALGMVDGDAQAFDAIELYSCFPVVPKMARRTLGLGAEVQPTVTGGLTFFGAPLNDYMAHAACAMVRKVRAGAKVGLLYGQGGFVTKHHGLVVSAAAPKTALAQDTSVQAEADRNRGEVPRFVTEASGDGKIESFTVIYGRGGNAEHGVVMLRTADNARALARVPAQDGATLTHLMDMERSPVGSSGAIGTAGDGVLEWKVG